MSEIRVDNIGTFGYTYGRVQFWAVSEAGKGGVKITGN